MPQVSASVKNVTLSKRTKKNGYINIFHDMLSQGEERKMDTEQQQDFRIYNNSMNAANAKEEVD
jgi:hypothetical protein